MNTRMTIKLWFNMWERGCGCVWCTLCMVLYILIEGVQSETVAPMTTSTANATMTSGEITTSFNLLIYFPQSAISLFSLGCFIGISVLVAMLTEKCYERLSLRDDASDMSEHTKEILKARILGMVFGKKLELDKMTEKQRAMELAKKYAHIWQYKAAMKKKRRIQQRQEEQKKKQEALKKRRSSLFGILSFGKSSDDNSSSSPEKSIPKSPQDHKSLTKKPSFATIAEGTSTIPANKRESSKDEFISIDMKPIATGAVSSDKSDTAKSQVPTSKETEDVTINMNNVTPLTKEDPDEFDIGEPISSNIPQAKQQQQQQKAQKTNTPSQKSSNPGLVSESSMYKYMRTRPPSALSTKMAATGANPTSTKATKKAVPPLTKQPSRPLTAGGSRPITAGAKRGTTDKDYKSQGKSVRSEVMKKLVP